MPDVTQFRSELEAIRISLHIEICFTNLCKSDSVNGKKKRKETSSSFFRVVHRRASHFDSNETGFSFPLSREGERRVMKTGEL